MADLTEHPLMNELRSLKARIWQIVADRGIPRSERPDSETFQTVLAEFPDLRERYTALRHEIRLATEPSYAAKMATAERRRIREERSARREARAREIQSAAATRQLTPAEEREWVGTNPRRRGDRCYECGTTLQGWGFSMVTADPDLAGAGDDGGDALTVTVCRECLINCLLPRRA